MDQGSYSGSGGGDCVEVAIGLSKVYVRDSKAVERSPVTVSPAPSSLFLSHLQPPSHR
ncbi:DUF397 domain-containing protein [Streptomyces sp. NPDC056704]|uniref:DUF397 domain-containing protein n=1 Tax=Streptomyces sp. NPDC056704 TaxID=3345917 RepID=UPI003674F01A